MHSGVGPGRAWKPQASQRLELRNGEPAMAIIISLNILNDPISAPKNGCIYIYIYIEIIIFHIIIIYSDMHLILGG